MQLYRVLSKGQPVGNVDTEPENGARRFPYVGHVRLVALDRAFILAEEASHLCQRITAVQGETVLGSDVASKLHQFLPRHESASLPYNHGKTESAAHKTSGQRFKIHRKPTEQKERHRCLERALTVFHEHGPRKHRNTCPKQQLKDRGK